jgi:very-short-patch-repair endonuclease
MTEAERRLWNALRAHRLMGLGFRRQMPIAGFIADFACSKHRLIVEIDGSGHGEDRQIARDVQRTATLEASGWTVIRFWNDDVLCDLDAVCDHILRTIGLDRLEHPPLPAGISPARGEIESSQSPTPFAEDEDDTI